MNVAAASSYENRFDHVFIGTFRLALRNRTRSFYALHVIRDRPLSTHVLY